MAKKKSSKVRSFVAFVILLVVMMLIDAFWMGLLAHGFYKEQMAGLLKNDVFILPALGVYLLLVFGIRNFVLPISESAGDAVLKGAWLGIIV